MNIETLREFLGWCLVINVGILLLVTVKLMVIRGWASKIHSKMFDVDEAWVRQAYFSYLANYKIAVCVFQLGAVDRSESDGELGLDVVALPFAIMGFSNVERWRQR